MYITFVFGHIINIVILRNTLYFITVKDFFTKLKLIIVFAVNIFYVVEGSSLEALNHIFNNLSNLKCFFIIFFVTHYDIFTECLLTIYVY